MTVKDVVLELIRLAEARNTEDQTIDDELGIGDLGYEYGSDQAWKSMMTPRPCEVSLTNYLEGLPPETTFKLRTLMYCGRGDADDIHEFHVELVRLHPDTESAIQSMVEKVPLPNYLRRGLELANTKRVDLEAQWPTTSRRTKPTRPTTRPASETVVAPPRVFPPGSDPVHDGGAIFARLATEWVGDTIVAPAHVEKFFNTLHQRTGGLVILDFIDLAGWDGIDGYPFDASSGYLESCVVSSWCERVQSPHSQEREGRRYRRDER